MARYRYREEKTFAGKSTELFFSLIGLGTAYAGYKHWDDPDIEDDILESKPDQELEFSRMHTMHSISQSMFCFCLNLYAVQSWVEMASGSIVISIVVSLANLLI